MGCYMYPSTMAALARDHGHGDFKQEVCILSEFWKSEIQGQQSPALSEALA